MTVAKQSRERPESPVPGCSGFNENKKASPSDVGPPNKRAREAQGLPGTDRSFSAGNGGYPIEQEMLPPSAKLHSTCTYRFVSTTLLYLENVISKQNNKL